MSITSDTRWESFEKLNRKRLYDLIVTVLKGNKGGLTAREIAVVLYNQGFIRSNERQAVQPRLTELIDKNIVEVVGKKKDFVTLKNVVIYSLVKENDNKEGN